MSQRNTDYNVVKKPADDEPLTDWQLEEFIRCAKNVEYFLENYVYVQHPTEGACLFVPRRYQYNMIDLFKEEQFLVMNLPRQTGKTTTSGGYLLHKAIFQPNTNIGITSNKQANVKDIMDRIRFAYENLPFWLKPPVTEYNKFNIAFTNHSSIEGATTTESTFRGRSMNLLFLDEFAFVKPDTAEEFWSSILPVISAAGSSGKRKTQVIIASTPAGTEGPYADIWFGAEYGENGFKSFKVEPEEIPGRDENFKQQMLQKMTIEKYLQEYCGHFISSKATLIRSTVLESIKTSEPMHESNDLYVFGDFENKKMALSVDVGEGVGNDYHAIQGFSIDDMEQLVEFRNNTMTQHELVNVIIQICAMCIKGGASEMYLGVENNGVGVGVINLLMNAEDQYLDQVTMVHDITTKKHGIPTTSKTKIRGCMLLKDLVESWRLTLHSKRLISELKFFVKKGGSYASEREKGSDDLAMGCVLFCNMLDLLASHEESVYDTLNTVHTGDEEEQEMAFDPMPIIGGDDPDDLTGWTPV